MTQFRFVLALGLLAFIAADLLTGHEDPIWLPALGIGIALVSWGGWWLLPVLAVDLLVVGLLRTPDQAPLVAIRAVLLTLQIGLSWRVYHVWLHGSRWFEDPRSATVFLLVVPGAGSLTFGVVDALAAQWQLDTAKELPELIGIAWLTRALGVLVVLPPLLVLLTPFLLRKRLLASEPIQEQRFGLDPVDWTWGEMIELGGLCLGNAILSLVLVVLASREAQLNWSLWGFSLLLVVWCSLRQGLRGGTLCAGVGGALALVAAELLGFTPSLFSPLQGNLLAQCSTALLVGASYTWIRTHEARYRHVAGQIPVVLYSARLSRPIPAQMKSEAGPNRKDSKPDMRLGPAISAKASILLVSPAGGAVFDCDPNELIGPHSAWMQRIVAEDREVVIASLMQLCLQRQPVTCEYRVQGSKSLRWVRESLAPFQSEDGMLHGWDAVVEDITESRVLSQSLRRTSAMLQSLIANLPMGVFFVQGPRGVPLLVNARARLLLGQREEMSAGIAHLPQVYRLHRTDGSPYPAEELPVSRALLSGTTCTASDIVVHRPDGRKIALMCWAAPINLGGAGKVEAAVWVMEDFTILRRAESESRESEQRLRTVLDAMPEGVLVLNADGAVVDGNPAAGAVLGLSREAMLLQKEPFLGFLCLNRDNEVVPAESQPHAEALRGSPVHGTTLGLRRDLEGPVRWLRVSATPLPVGPALGLNRARARVVVTFAEPSREEAPSLPALLASFAALPLEDTLLQQQIVELGRQMLALARSAEPHGSAGF